MINSKIIDLRTAKSLSEIELINYIDYLSSVLKNNTKSLSKLEQLFNEHGISFKKEPEFLLFSGLLAVVLGDIGTQQSPSLRDDNIKKIRSICQQKNIKYETISLLSSDENRLINALD